MSSDRAECAALREAIEYLEQRLQILIQAIDALSDEIQWHNRQDGNGSARHEPFVLRSMPADPRDDDWSVNRVPREEVAAIRDQVVQASADGRWFD